MPSSVGGSRSGATKPEPAQSRRERGDRHRRRLYSPPCLCREGRAVLNRLFELGEGALGRLAEELLSNPRIATAFAQALTKAIETKGTVDRNMQTVLGLLNVPSRERRHEARAPSSRPSRATS